MTIRDNFLSAFYNFQQSLPNSLTADLRRQAYFLNKPYGRLLSLNAYDDYFDVDFPAEYQDMIYDDEFGIEGEAPDAFIRNYLTDIDEDDLNDEFDYHLNEWGLF